MKIELDSEELERVKQAIHHLHSYLRSQNRVDATIENLFRRFVDKGK